ncbi:unnamed protein product [Urochloa decumbens]|uniref:WRKY domain-containing protein n=1 Tax=Urochloa decumbens TaxID=240449 RepID=A0ABC9GXG3_9POAL
MEDDMGGFGYPQNATNWDLDAVARFSCGVSLPPPSTNHDPFAQFPPLQPQAPQQQEMPAPDAVEWQLTPDLPLATDLTAVGSGGSLDEGIFVWPDQPQPEDLPGSTELDLDLPLQPSSATKQTLAPVLQPPAEEPPLADKTEDSNSSGGDGSSRSKRQYSKKKDRTVKQVLDLDSAPPQDEWAWRKYGQKVIKGSQYLRSYYKCSSDKKCKARKYVDRSTVDSRYFIVSYDGEHAHAMPPFRKITTVPQAPAPQPSAAPSPIPAVEETWQDHAPPAIASAPLSSPTTPLRSPFAELDLDVEDYRDTMDVTMLLREEDMTTEDAAASMLFVEQDGLQELKDGAHGNGGGDNNNIPMPYEHAAGGGDGSTRTGPFQTPAENVFNETFCFEPWESLLDWP